MKFWSKLATTCYLKILLLLLVTKKSHPDLYNININCQAVSPMLLRSIVSLALLLLILSYVKSTQPKNISLW